MPLVSSSTGFIIVNSCVSEVEKKTEVINKIGSFLARESQIVQWFLSNVRWEKLRENLIITGHISQTMQTSALVIKYVFAITKKRVLFKW